MLVIAKPSIGCFALHPSIPFPLGLYLLNASMSLPLMLARTFGRMIVGVAENRDRGEEELARAMVWVISRQYLGMWSWTNDDPLLVTEEFRAKKLEFCFVNELATK